LHHSTARNLHEGTKAMKKYLVIVINHSYAGFFAYVNFAINQIIQCEKHGLIPVVYFGPDSQDGRNAFIDLRRGDNMWDYYFEPVAGITHQELMSRMVDPDDSLSSDDVITLTPDELWDIHCRTPESVFPYPHSMHRDSFDGGTAWYDDQRERGRRVCDAYVRVKPHINEIVDQFVAANFGDGPVLGVHLRGSDKGTADGSVSLMRIVPPREYFPRVDAYLKSNAQARIFAASDQAQYIQALKSRYGERVISYDALRTYGMKNPFDKDDGEGYRKGEDVLVDCLLLSRCDHLLKCTSAVGEFAMYFNPQLTCEDLNLQPQSPSIFDSLRLRLLRKLARRRRRRRSRAYRRAKAQ